MRTRPVHGRTRLHISATVLLGTLLVPSLTPASPDKNKPAELWTVEFERPYLRPTGSRVAREFRAGGGKVVFVGAEQIALTRVKGCAFEDPGPRVRCFFESVLLDAATGKAVKRLDWESNSVLATSVGLANLRIPVQGRFDQSPSTREPLDPHGYAVNYHDRLFPMFLGTWAMSVRTVGGKLRLELFQKSPAAMRRPGGCSIDIDAWNEVRCEDGVETIPFGVRIASGSVHRNDLKWEILHNGRWQPYAGPKDSRPVDAFGDGELLVLQSGNQRLLTDSSHSPLLKYRGKGDVRAAASSGCSRVVLLEGVDTNIYGCRTPRVPGDFTENQRPCMENFSPTVQTSLSVTVLDLEQRSTVASLGLGVSDWEVSDVALSPDGQRLAVFFNGKLSLYQLAKRPSAATRSFCGPTPAAPPSALTAAQLR